MDVDAPHRRRQENTLPPTEENAPDVAVNYYDGHDTNQGRDAYAVQEQKQSHEYTAKSHRNVMDADGYPISSTGYGWDKQADLLPPGGTDMLFQHRSGEVEPLQLSNIRKMSVSNQEIKFQAPTKSSHERHIATATTNPNISMKRRQDSFESGPMFLPDDVPNNLENADGPDSPKQTRLQVQGSEVVSGGMMVNELQRYNTSENEMSFLPPGLTTKTQGTQKSHAPYQTTESYMRLFNGRSHAPISMSNRDVNEYMSGNMFDGRRHSDESSSYSTSSSARPLVNRDLRGRPDDDSIHEPSTTIKSTYPNYPLMGALPDDVHDDDSPNNWLGTTSTHSPVNDGVNGAKKAPPEQYAPEVSPMGAVRRGGAQDDIVVREESGERMRPSEPIYMSDSDDRVAHKSHPIPPAPTLHKQNNNYRAISINPKNDFPPALVTEMVRKLSFTPQEEKGEPPLAIMQGACALEGQEQTIDDFPSSCTV